MADPKITKMEVIEFEYFVENMEGSGRIVLPLSAGYEAASDGSCRRHPHRCGRIGRIYGRFCNRALCDRVVFERGNWRKCIRS